MTVAVKEILRQAEPLSADEQLTLAAMLIEQARKKAAAPIERRKWLDMAGAAPYPLTGEDAQAWITRTRQEGDDERERLWTAAQEVFEQVSRRQESEDERERLWRREE